MQNYSFFLTKQLILEREFKVQKKHAEEQWQLKKKLHLSYKIWTLTLTIIKEIDWGTKTEVQKLAKTEIINFQKTLLPIPKSTNKNR